MRFHFLMAGLLLMVSLLLFATGCGGYSVAPVSGRVTLAGKPLANATIIFSPISEEKNPGPGSQAKTDRDGKFTLKLMTADRNGAIVGKHKVTITAYEGDDGEVSSSAPDKNVFRKPLVGDEFNANSKLTFDVPSAGTTEANFEVGASAPGSAPGTGTPSSAPPK
jgi:hypothetical protein